MTHVLCKRERAPALTRRMFELTWVNSNNPWYYCLMPSHIHLIPAPRNPEGLARAVVAAHLARRDDALVSVAPALERDRAAKTGAKGEDGR